MNYGATIYKINVPDKNGNLINVVVSLNKPEDYFSEAYIEKGLYLGTMVGRYAGRISNGGFEIDEDAYEECVDNFENSPWSDRLFCYHAGLDEFLEEMEDESYDLIISNPPFYTDEYKSDTKKRNLARFEDALPFEELIESAANL